MRSAIGRRDIPANAGQSAFAGAVVSQKKLYSRCLLAGILGGLSVLSALSAEAQMSPASSGICPAQLRARIDAIADRPAFQRARWGILVRSLDGDETLYDREATRLFIPASNAKLLTTAAVLTQLGPNFRIRTSVYRESSSTGIALRVVGRGDPSLTDRELGQLAQQVRSSLLSGDAAPPQVARLTADDRYFQGDPINPNWEWEDLQAGYGAPVNSLIVNHNAIALNLMPQRLGQPLRVVWQDPTEATRWQVENTSRTVAASEPEFTQVGRDLTRPLLRVAGQLRVGAEPEEEAIAVWDPAQNFLRRFRDRLNSVGIRVGQEVVLPGTTALEAAGSPALEGAEVAAVTSAPLSELLVETNQESDNLYAEALLRILGNSTTLSGASSPELGSLERGLGAIASVLTRLGVAPNSYALADGSGLSRKNLVSPAAFVETLRAMHNTPQALVYRNSLAIAGVSGTLANRFRDTPVQGRLWGKTGAISGIAALSGYLAPPNYSPLAFSIVVNHFDQPVRTIRPAMDEVVLLLANLRPCP